MLSAAAVHLPWSSVTTQDPLSFVKKISEKEGNKRFASLLSAFDRRLEGSLFSQKEAQEVANRLVEMGPWTESFLFDVLLLVGSEKVIAWPADLRLFGKRALRSFVKASDTAFLKRIEEAFQQIFAANRDAFEEFQTQPEVLWEYAQAISRVSFPAQTGVLAIDAVLQGRLLWPGQEIWQTLLEKTLWWSGLFRQESRKLLWSKTAASRKHQEAQKKSQVQGTQRLSKDHTRSPKEESLLRQQKEELFEEFAHVRQRASQAKEPT